MIALRGPAISINRDDNTDCSLGNDLRFWGIFFVSKALFLAMSYF